MKRPRRWTTLALRMRLTSRRRTGRRRGPQNTRAAHPAGVIAAETTLPVIGVPIPSTPLNGMDSLLAIVQMPAGIPVATTAIGKAGATNAGILAAQILGLSNATVAGKLKEMKGKLVRSVEEKSQKLQQLRKRG